MSRRVMAGVLLCAVLTDPVAACLNRVIVRPTGTITSDDPVSLEIHIHTPTTPANLAQPTEVDVVAFEILVDLYAEGGPYDSPDSMIETVDLGTLAPGTYTYEVAQHDTEHCDAFVLTGSFCVEDAACNSWYCRCPVWYPRYTIIDLGTLGGHASRAYAINNLGDVAGSAYTAEFERHACVWKDGAIIDLGALTGPDPQSWAKDINNVGQVVGVSRYAGWRAVLWDDGEIIDLGTLNADSYAEAINDAGQIVGYSLVAYGEPHAVLWDDGVMTDLTALGFASGVALDVSPSGAVVGGCCIWNAGIVTDLGSLGANATGALGLNDSLAVVGASGRVPGEGIFHAFLWQDGEMTDLGALAGFDSSEARAINNMGQIVGAGGAGKVGGSFLYDPREGFAYLQDLIPVDSGWTDLSVRDINDAGQIVGHGTLNGQSYRAFLMNPVPPVPAVSSGGMVVMTSLLVGVGIVLIACNRRHRRSAGA